MVKLAHWKGSGVALAQVIERPAHIAVGSIASIRARARYFRFTPNFGFTAPH